MTDDYFTNLYEQMLKNMEEKLIPKRVRANEETIDYLVSINEEDYDIETATIRGIEIAIDNDVSDFEIIYTPNVNILELMKRDV